MRTPHQNRVDKFMRLAGQDVPETPTIPTSETRLLRAKLIMEEAVETCTALGIDIEIVNREVRFFDNGNFDINETIDGCCDIIVVTTGTFSALGVSAEDVQVIVDNNNLAKFGPGGYRRDDGKWIKPPDHKPPTEAIRAELNRQRKGV